MTDKKVIIVDGNVCKETLKAIRNRLSEKYIVYTITEAQELGVSLKIIETAWVEDLKETAQNVIKAPWQEANGTAYILRLAKNLGPSEDLQRNMRKEHLEEIHPKHQHKYRPPKKLTKCKKGWR